MKSICLAFVLWLAFSQGFATSYYISAKGNDQNKGTSKTSSWRSISKVNDAQSAFVAGDSILFERGSVFKGTLLIQFSGQKGKEIYVGAYGNGDLPIISGASEIVGWKPYSKNIWVSELSVVPVSLFVGDRQMPLGRYPNAGYRVVSSPAKNDLTFDDKSIPSADGYWDNAEVVIKSSRWTLDRLLVKEYRNKTFVLAAPASYPIPDGFGYFIQNHIQALDLPGEWFHDPKAGKIYLVAAAQPTNVSVSNSGPGLKATGIHDVIIENIDISQQAQEGVILKDSENITVRNIQISFSGTDGMHIIGCRNFIVEACRIADSGNNGVEWRSNLNGSFIKNRIVRSGVVPGQGKSGNGTYIALSIPQSLPLAGRNVFQENTIDSTGYLGIDFRTAFTRIVNNVVSNFCLVKDDGAGIYTWGNEGGGNVIEGNIVVRGQGSGLGTSHPTQRYAHGIYIDDRSADVTIKGNTVAYCASSGIFIHNARRLEISGNTLFANGTSVLNREKGQLFIKRDGIVKNMANDLQLRIDNNKLVSIDEVTPCLMVGGPSNVEISSLGSLEKNTFAAPRPQQVVSRLVSQGGMCEAPFYLTLTEWQASGFDSNSAYTAIQSNITEASTPNLVKNSTMASTDGWHAWPDQATLVQDKNQLLDGPSLRVAPAPSGAEVLLYHAGFALKAGMQYRLTFVARSSKPAQIQFVPLMAVDPWKALSDYACFSVDNTSKEFVWYFSPDVNFNSVRVNFKSNVEFWIDNVVLQEAGKQAKAAVALHYNPTSKPIEVNSSGSMEINGTQSLDQLTLPPFRSTILLGHKGSSPKR